MLYEVTDVKDLHDWNVKHLEEHPMFERIPDDEVKDDVGVKAMREETDEAQKVIRNGGQIWHAVFRKKDLNNETE